jgi:hypothetical protein
MFFGLLCTGCALDRTGLVASDGGGAGPARDAGSSRRDADAPFDTGRRDAGDAPRIDAGSRDAGMDAGFDACTPVFEECNARDDDCDSSVDEDGCPCEVQVYGGRTYLFCWRSEGGERTAAEAETFCRDRGYEVVPIEDNAENAFVMEHAFDNDRIDWLIGLTDEREEGIWRKPDGTIATYLGFVSPEPNGGLAENCCEIRPGNVWNDCDCALPRPFVCRSLP